ncbi:MBL fold metallo-hydrolase [Paenibacillus sp. UMB4589-SE434]|uniref:MBL fold metallo-hydrolase n=1 Tax=Paenibacillus sp. UMB4589-SE434 TaxID=3046314 RepID=UPI00254D6B97|nr:MBL fold metallo-hydrolase [Paenibacillus sp. UMB4589-SE434]MDK8179879.1 MBL fold metallo-hydrolase [Paenibacillus sp. UMB4589-SE434]
MKDTKLELINGNSYMYDANLAVGVYFNENSRAALLIDSGANENAAKRIEHFVKKKGYYISSIIVTHGHLAQLGGLPYFKKNYANLRVYATSWTAQFMEHRALENWLSGHIPCVVNEIEEEMVKNAVTDIIPFRDHDIVIDEITFSIVTLPGHFPGMVGVVTPDQVFYSADAIFGNKTLIKQKLLYYTDIKGAKDSLDKLAAHKHAFYVLSHGGKYNDVKLLIQQHQHLIDETSNFIFGIISEHPLTLESIVQRVMKEYQLKNKPGHYTLTNTIVRSYLTALHDGSKLRASVNDGILYYYDRASVVLV